MLRFLNVDNPRLNGVRLLASCQQSLCAEELGCKGVRVSAHPPTRPPLLCAVAASLRPRDLRTVELRELGTVPSLSREKGSETESMIVSDLF